MITGVLHIAGITIFWGRMPASYYLIGIMLQFFLTVGTMPDNNPPGIPLADEVCFMNIADPDEVAKKAAKLKLDGVATCCLDTGISALGKTCDSLGLTGLQEKAAIMCNDKSKMKKAFMEYGVSTAQYFEISSEEELKNACHGAYPWFLCAGNDVP